MWCAAGPEACADDDACLQKYTQVQTLCRGAGWSPCCCLFAPSAVRYRCAERTVGDWGRQRGDGRTATSGFWRFRWEKCGEIREPGTSLFPFG